MQTENHPEDAPLTPAATPKERDAIFDVAKGIGIVFVLVIHSTGNSARLYTVPHSIPWWVLTIFNRFASFAVPMFLMISAILSARTLCRKPQVLPFYRRRLAGVIWPYLVWSFVYFGLKLLSDPSARKMEAGDLLGLHFTGPALLTHVKARLLDLAWGKASFHLYFMVALLQLLIVLPPTVRYIRWRKPGFAEIIVTSILLQAAIFVAQHKTALLPYPASTVFWYVGSLLPGAWIGVNWDTFKEWPYRYGVPMGILAAIAFVPYLQQELLAIQHLGVDNYTSNGSLTAYASCFSIFVLAICFFFKARRQVKAILEPLGILSLQIYLIHPAVIAFLEKPAIVHTLNATYLGPLLSPMLMLGITLGLIWLFRLLRVEKLLFGR